MRKGDRQDESARKAETERDREHRSDLESEGAETPTPRLLPGEAARTLPWYDPGLRFRCTRCGDCCTGAPGWVTFTEPELRSMAAHLGILPLEFLARYARRDKGRWRLRELPSLQGLDCVFLRRDLKGLASCAIHAVRPSQCRTWPFWPESIQSREAWDAIRKDCPGVRTRDDSPESFYSTKRIEEISRGDGAT